MADDSSWVVELEHPKEWRPPWGHITYLATSNERPARHRHQAVHVHRLDRPALIRDRDQLWAEAARVAVQRHATAAARLGVALCFDSPEPAAVHQLKTWPAAFAATWAGDKRYELRRDDRSFRVGDSLDLREWDPRTLDYSGRRITAGVTCITRAGDFPGLLPRHVILWLGPPMRFPA